jgi:hypothetical protein
VGDVSQSDEGKPRWERRFPGRFEWEKNAFAEANIDPLIDDEALADGRLELSFEWPLGDRLIPLRAAYPDSYPFLRPQILVSDPAFFPKRHYSPADGNICLLGRNTRNWATNWTVPEPLRRQLHDVYDEGADEDPLGEPADVWWNNFAPPDSYCLIASSWSLASAHGPGKMKLLYSASLGEAGKPVLRAVVKSVRDAGHAPDRQSEGPSEGVLEGRDIEQASILSSKVRLSRLDHTRPSWMRTASGTQKTLLAASTSKPTACMECPMMYSGLVFDSDC